MGDARLDPPDRFHDLVASPLGELLLLGDGRSLTGLYMPDGPRPAPVGGARSPGAAPFPAVRAQLGEYFAGERREFELALVATGTDFQRRVWDELARVALGETITYGELARRIGAAGAARAVGSANARNPISVVIPCHRLVGSGRELTGYGGGMERKRFLLALEAGVAAGAGPPTAITSPSGSSSPAPRRRRGGPG